MNALVSPLRRAAETERLAAAGHAEKASGVTSRAWRVRNFGRHSARAGFTFIEIMIVMAVIVILVSLAVPMYQKSILRAKESVLKNNLFTMRTVIDEYTYDKQKAPQSLQDLVTEGYLRDIPSDPMTGSNQTWKIVLEEATQSVNQSEPGIFDVKSGSDKMGLDGTPYSDW